MNVKQLIENYKKLEGVWDAEGAELARQIFLQDLEQLDEPEKVTIPQVVAAYIEFQKKNNFHVYGAMRVIEDHYDKRVPEWFYEKISKHSLVHGLMATRSRKRSGIWSR